MKKTTTNLCTCLLRGGVNFRIIYIYSDYPYRIFCSNPSVRVVGKNFGLEVLDQSASKPVVYSSAAATISSLASYCLNPTEYRE